MANVISPNVYQINNNAVTGTIVKYGISVAGCLFRPLTGQTVGSVNVYSVIQTPNGSQFYVVETVAALTTLANA